MFQDRRINIIIIIVVVLILIYLLMSRSKQTTYNYVVPEQFARMRDDPYRSQPLNDIKNLTIDTMVCHPDCCNTQWPAPFDGLTEKEIQQAIAINAISKNSPYASTSYTCANGPNGVGCPCIPKKTNTLNENLNLNINGNDIDSYFNSSQYSSIE